MKRKIILMSITIVFVFLFSSCLDDGANPLIEKIESDDDNSEVSANIEIEDEKDFGAKGALTSEVFTLEEMLNFAIEDEYLARQEYESIMDVYGQIRPFSNIIKAEETHIEMLKDIFEEYDLQLPLDTSIEHVVVPDELDLIYEIGVQAEIDNIAMYEVFLKQDISNDIREIFIELRDASKNHLAAFQRGNRGRGNK